MTNKPGEPYVTCSSQLVDGVVRGFVTGGMWGVVAAPLGIPKNKLAQEFTLQHTARSALQNALIFGSFLSIFTGVQCSLAPVLAKFKLVNAFLSGSTAGFCAAFIDSRNVPFARKVGPLAGICTTVIVYLKDKIDDGPQGVR